VVFTMFQKEGLSFDDVHHAIISSVVPDLNHRLRAICQKNFGCLAVFVDRDLVQNIIDVDIQRPEDIGADRLVNAIATKYSDYGVPAIVIDFGTATTFDVIKKGGVYSGGLICPGVNLSMQALQQAAAKLPKISIRRPEKVIGTNTVEAMQSGIFWGYVSMIEGILARIEDELGYKCSVIATGGLAKLYSNAIEAIEHVDDELTLKGLLYIHTHITKSASKEAAA